MRSATLVLAALATAACSRPQAAARPPQVGPEAPHAQHSAASAAAVAAGHAQLGQGGAPGPGAAGAPRAFGEPVGAGVPRVRLAEIVAAPQQHSGHPIRVEGTVAAVCQNMGCWMEIRDEATQAHIRMHGHSFFVPRDISGRHASVQATLVAAHPATECDQEAQAATGRVAQVELEATGVQVD